MLIQIHILQNYAPSNLNRDDTGSPKDAVFGGVRRGRISSQCLKRSMRGSVAFEQAFEQSGLLGKRTRRLPGEIYKALQDMKVDEKVAQAIVARVPEIGRESTKGGGKEESEESLVETETKQLIFVGANEVTPLAEKLLALYQEHGDKKWAKLKIAEITKALGESTPRSVDIAMFGRMTTSEAFKDIQAAVQVAHVLSTNALAQEFDYFTAMDDISGQTSAEMIGDVEFNSSTYYKYLNVYWEQLLENLGGDTAIARQAVLALLEAAATAQPSGKQNTFAAHNLPDLVLVEVREKNLPVSFANAFIKPVRETFKRSLMDVSVEQLADYMTRVSKTYSLNGQRAMIAVQDYTLPGVEVQESLPDLQGWLGKQLPE